MCYHECTLFKQIFKRICEGDDEQSVLPGQITCSKMEVIFLRLFICGGNTTSVKDHYKSARQFGPFLEEVFETNLSGNNSWIPAEGQRCPGNNAASLCHLSHDDKYLGGKRQSSCEACCLLETEQCVFICRGRSGISDKKQPTI